MNRTHSPPPPEGPSLGRQDAPVPSTYTALARYLDELVSCDSEPKPALSRCEPFTCQLFEAAGVVLAAPVRSLQLLPGMPLHPVPGNAPFWIAGCCDYLGKTLVVVDLAALVSETRAPLPPQAAGQVSQLLLLDGSVCARGIALQPQRLLATAILDPERICWRTARTSRAWLMGVSADPPCALLDLAALAAAALAAVGMESAKTGKIG